MVHGLATQNRLTKHVHRRGRLGVGIAAKLQERLAVGHDGSRIRRPHIASDVARLAPTRRVALLPALLGEELQVGVEAFVHPGPLALVGVDDHGKPVVAHFMDDHADQAVFGALGVGSIFFGSWPVEADHGVFHTSHRTIDADRCGVRIRKGIVPIHFEGLRDGMGAVPAPEWLALTGPVRHGHDGTALPFDLDTPRVPQERGRRCPCHIANIIGPKDPCLGAGRVDRSVGIGLLLGDDHHRRLCGSRLGQATTLVARQHLARIAEHTARGHHIGVGYGDAELVVPELQRELPAPKKGLVLPSVDIGVGRHSRKPLRNLVDGDVILEDLQLAPSTHDLGRDVVVPVDLKRKRPPRPERLRQLDAHHRVDDAVGQRTPLSVFDAGHVGARLEGGLHI